MSKHLNISRGLWVHTLPYKLHTLSSSECSTVKITSKNTYNAKSLFKNASYYYNHELLKYASRKSKNFDMKIDTRVVCDASTFGIVALVEQITKEDWVAIV